MNLTDIVKNTIYSQPISEIKTDKKCFINTINAYSFCIAKKDAQFAEILNTSDVLLPDGTSIVLASKLLGGKKIKKIAGWDIHQYLLSEAQKKELKVFYLGAAESTLELIKARVSKEFPKANLAFYSPPYKKTFSKADNDEMITQVNAFSPDILFIGMTAPKQEKWGQEFKNDLDTNIICSIGAVFDFYAGTVNRAPQWILNLGLEWFYRLIKEPKRMWRRYLVGNTQFVYYVLGEKLKSWF
jgi:N-acetylglucosaminyldiphosphoundecaprenol N-acetyl-beta-D-mannosaminyltransferase